LFFSFFFSSRRRHTRSKRDWSSDVCSSDLAPWRRFGLPAMRAIRKRRQVAALQITEFLLSRQGATFPRFGAPSAATSRRGSRLRSEERRVGKESRAWWATVT